MEIKDDTRISQLVKQDKRSIDALARLAKPFEKLRNPILRRALAGRTSLKQAARMGKCSVADLAEALRPLGFVYKNDGGEQPGQEAPGHLPEFVGQLEHLPKEVLDVREDIAAGKDPLKLIMKAVKDLPEGHVLQVVNSFEPTPLIHLLEKKGYAHYVKTITAEEVHAFFKKEEDAEPAEDDVDMQPETVSREVFESKLASFGQKVRQVDVSMLEMPMPMVTILETLSALPEDHVLKVHHRRVPIFLFNELKERRYSWHLLQESPDDVNLLIFRQ